MREMIKERGKDRIANVAQRNSVYQTIDRLLRAELIAVRETARDERRPERTVYEITDAGHEALHTWTAEMLESPAREFPEFPAALASAMILTSRGRDGQAGEASGRPDHIAGGGPRDPPGSARTAATVPPGRGILDSGPRGGAEVDRGRTSGAPRW
ncbi:PadR family transcriptional regulator [Saccharopolyspora shandongensis]|uniref:PadR family transcriptional regulator n=1 Tax=Saccharopolyspora shandongensis TaxID=418495 RepID=UPI0034311F74